ncbi:glycosyltransferase [Jeotgalibaca sp. MA1X17-3]|uniref:glycosyltransferase n=1 Tax=Jeotgalibaca sp. MA1X17-3 TaxID=2908211 RepID=UPI002107B174|nr:glycosyltransferase [Jeotgalibaca sp. MA1X17-3]
MIVNKKSKKEELGIPFESQVLLSIGELNENKNHETVIRAIAKLNNDKIHYVICGEGQLKKYLINLSKDLEVEKQVHLIGIRKDISEICRVSDIFVFPSFREGLSVALMESMASGLPVICSDIRGNNDLIDNKKGGFLIKPRNINDYIKCINELINSTKLKKEFSQYNLKKIKSFSINSVLSSLEYIYKQ